MPYLLLLLSSLIASAVDRAPPPGVALPCRVTHVVDGDTLDVDVTIRIRVRLLDCWAPESNEPGGAESMAHLEQIAAGKKAVLFVPWAEHSKDMFSFGRALGRVWVGKIDLSAAQVEAGHATKTKVKP